MPGSSPTLPASKRPLTPPFKPSVRCGFTPRPVEPSVAGVSILSPGLGGLKDAHERHCLRGVDREPGTQPAPDNLPPRERGVEERAAARFAGGVEVVAGVVWVCH